MRDLSKSYPGVRALDRVRLEVQRGTVHALMGENGAGKSTLMKVLAGLETPDSGEILLDGRPVALSGPHAALRRDIAMIHQELLPFTELTVAENIFMGQQPASRLLGWLDKPRMRDEARQLLEWLGATISPEEQMGRLGVAEMQTVEIAKALAYRASILLMDEPTSALSRPEVEALLGVIRDLTRRGVAVVFTSHKLDEVFRLADTVTVLRDGQYVATHGIGELDPDRLVRLMVGRELTPARGKPASSQGEVVIEVRGLSLAGHFQDIGFSLRRGEVLGLAGLMGAGRTELAGAIYGLTPADEGEIRVRGRRVRIAHPRDAIAQGIGLVSEDRKKFGLVLNLSVKHNLTLSNLESCSRAGFIDARRENRLADERIGSFAIRTPDRDQPVIRLSGGNQQKVVVAKALLSEPDILILDEPTRGIDIGAKAEIHGLIQRLAGEGRAILLISSELPEILSLSHRILVICAGRVAGELNPATTTAEEVMRLAMPRGRNSWRGGASIPAG